MNILLSIHRLEIKCLSPLFYVIICAQYKNCEGSNERVRYLLFNSMLVLYPIEIKLLIEYVYDDDYRTSREIELLFFHLPFNHSENS